jgi:intein/homing endonuclease
VAHWDEEAYFEITESKDPMLASLQCFADELPISLGIRSSTANSASGAFYDDWVNDGNDWHKIFAAWFEFEDSKRAFKSDEERREFIETLREDEREEMERFPGQVSFEHLHWRRKTIENKCKGDIDRFRREFPSDDLSCLDGDSLIPTDQGMIPIKEVRAGMRTLWGEVKAQAYMGEKETVEITTELGYRLILTPDHLVELPDGSFLRADKTLGVEIQLNAPIFADDYFVKRWVGFGGVRNELKIDEDFGRFLGYFMGDGDYNGTTLGICLDGRDTDVEDDYRRLITRIFGVELSSRRMGNKNGGLYLRCANVRFRKIFNQLGILKKIKNKNGHVAYKRNVNVPECIWRSPNPVVREFLKGLFDSDGWIGLGGHPVKFFTKHIEFMREVQLLLLGFGVHSNFRKVIKKANDKEYTGYELVMNPYDSHRFSQEIGFISQRKRSREVRKDYTPPVHGRPPVKRMMTDKIASIEPAGVRKVYDLEIDGKPVFGGNGISVHNCFRLSGSPRYNLTSLAKMREIAQRKPRAERGTLVSQDNGRHYSFNRDDGGDVQIAEHPRLGCRYLVSADTCAGEDQQLGGGGSNPDFHDVQVWRAPYLDFDEQSERPAKIVARHRSQIESDMLAEVIAAFSIYYGRCLVVPEINGESAHHIVKLLLKLGVPVYRRQKISGNVMKKTSDERIQAYGWRTGPLNRKYMIDLLAEPIRELEVDFTFEEVIKEFECFVRDKKGKAQAMPGKHDDAVMSAAIGYYNLKSATELQPERRNVDMRRLRTDPSYLMPDSFKVDLPTG